MNNICVIIPTYNNQNTLEKVILKSKDYIKNIIVINDGSTDKTSLILKKFQNQILIITHKINQGKGKSLINGFKLAKKEGFRYAITLDSDGQHYPNDIPLFIKKIEKVPDSIIIGTRNLNQEGIPKKSSLGMNFSNFWFWFETGKKISDTQSGFRLYPLKKTNNMFFFTNRFEFEIEILVRLCWLNINIQEIPIKVKYDANERVSHFRPFLDFTRISILNTILVFIAIIYHIPIRILSSFIKKKHLLLIKKEFLSIKGNNLVKSLSIGFGVFMGIIPIWGFQIIVGLFLAHLLNLNKLLVLVFSNISIPVFLPFILYASYICGTLFFYTEPELSFSRDIDLNSIKTVAKQYVAGSFILAIFAGLVSSTISFIILSLIKKTPKDQ